MLLHTLDICAAVIVSASVLGYMGWELVRCHHGHELFDRYPDGRAALRCQNCLQLRPNILGTPPPSYHQTQTALARTAFDSGIEPTVFDLDFSEPQQEVVLQ
ncbi:MAG: hypothetical protein ACRD04_03870 [Terriglobales bacterium]